jgi:hypothetical protein
MKLIELFILETQTPGEQISAIDRNSAKLAIRNAATWSNQKSG